MIFTPTKAVGVCQLALPALYWRLNHWTYLRLPDNFSRAEQSLSLWWEDAGVSSIAQPTSKKPTKTTTPAKPRVRQNASVSVPNKDRLAMAQKQAASAKTLEELTAAIAGFDAGALSDGASRAVIARGNPNADIMLIGEAPGRDEDRIGKPFVGRSGQFLDKMFAAIGLGEDELYISNGVFWRPKGNRTPTPEETAMCLPFVQRHIALIAPNLLITIGGSASKTMLATETGITRLRGKWSEYTIKNADGSDSETVIPLLPMYHPAFVLRKPATKRQCWQDLQGLQERLQQL
ncbi:Uracil-DNA glycosylase, family 4 [hydrothermal vent metagenome]|uniref:Type-4 uracil-DNA glycosylase n=1 Tax=hydrothermal vent metagenome TaxID=652676 RepID=A0A3B0S5V4_9ZZZZ